MKLSRTVFTALAFAAVTGAHSAHAESFDINVVLPLTGGAAFLGKAEQQALELYAKSVSSDTIHGKQINFVFHDDQSSPQIAVQLVNSIKSNTPPVIIGSAVSGICNAMGPLAKSGPVLYCLSPSMNPKPGEFVFSSSVSTKGLAEGLLRYFRDRGWKNIGLITSTDATGQDAYKNITALVGNGDLADVKIVGEAQFNPTEVSASALVQRIKGANPDAVIAWSTGAPIGTIFKAIRDAGLDAPVGTTDGNMTYAQMEQYASFLPKELYIPAPQWLKSDKSDASPKAAAAKNDFYKAFEAAKIRPDGPSTFAWDPAHLVVSALKALPAGADAEALRAYLNNLQDFGGINGVYDFKRDPQRGLDKSNVVITRWDTSAGTWVAASGIGGSPLK
ncbi:MAG: ABC transporter substrate-binding protein [Alphaproteobacteria bacterium]|nr:ABC transporter substrate-binding protein [Alphaproteobacteria bacterium]MBU1552057.1 ABC transporter substrate-binding protein [Alphaproteobacteria bacterium]MBU2337667.1 ABC transporter substrate-binding protein [Alphaproteobacteria bacterium]MBU2391507.1 ABC transporter substrate-binding protein [Alphaproteobacteria bacterium]